MVIYMYMYMYIYGSYHIIKKDVSLFGTTL